MINRNTSMSEKIENKVIKKETVQRLLKDVKQIVKNPLTENGIYYQHDETDMLKGYAMIIGPEDTPYFGGFYFFEFTFPTDYPHSPPVVKYKTNADGIRFNPNLYTEGKVCVSILNTWSGDQWTSCQTITTILLTLCLLLNKEPLLNEPGVNSGHRDIKKYNKIIEYKNIDVAILKMLRKDTCFPVKFNIFHHIMLENFKKTYLKIYHFINNNNNKETNEAVLVTGYYNMTVKTDYNLLMSFFIDTCNSLGLSVEKDCEEK